MVNLLKENLFQITLIIFLVVVPFVSFAQTNVPAPNVSTKLINPINVNTINGFIKILLEGVLKIGIPIVALAIIYCGFLFVSARGKPEAITKARDALLYTLIGAAILLGSWAIATLISDTVLSIGSP